MKPNVFLTEPVTAAPKSRLSFLTFSLFIYWVCFFILSMAPSQAFASKTSYHLSHPITWMHQLPVGETPGWQKDYWINFELSLSNVWNAPIEFRNTSNGIIHSYTADYEQVSNVLEIGQALSDTLAHSLEIPYAYRDGGFLDNFIDEFHEFWGFDRFNRQLFDEDQSSFRPQNDGNDLLEEHSHSGFSNIKYKIKYWPVQWNGNKNNACPCGIASSLQIKFPVSDYKKGLTSGAIDASFLLHFGLPLFKYSSMWFTGAWTYLANEKTFDEWPRRRWAQMYEGSFDFALGRKWGLILQFRAESPFLNEHELEIQNLTGDRQTDAINRVASGWNSLVHWRGSQAFGFRYRPQSHKQYQLTLIEDWGIGNYDEYGDSLYINNAPDVALSFQYFHNF